MRRLLPLWFAGLLVFALVGCVASDGPIQPEPSEDAEAWDAAPQATVYKPVDFTCIPEAGGVPTENGTPEYNLQAGECFINNQIIVTGEVGALKAFKENSERIENWLREVRGEREGEFEIIGDPEILSIPRDPEVGDERNLGLLLLTFKNADARDVVNAVWVSNDPEEEPLFADLNYLIGSASLGCDIGAHPYGIGAHPFDPAAATAAVARDFQNQWALSTNAGTWGIGLYERTASGRPTRVVPDAGHGILVKVLDTSPFPNSGQHNLYLGAGVISDTFKLDVSNHLNLTHVIPVEPDRPDISNHGLLVAGLIHAVAPESEIELVRVLNQYGYGDLFSLLNGLIHVIHNVDVGKRHHTVVNMSLGVVAPCAVLTDEQYDIIMKQLKKMEELGSYTFRIPDHVRVASLEIVLRIMEDVGMTLVAAAGNNSAGSATPLPAHIPAVYDFVNGVMASGPDGKRACYSNHGDFAAPGGNPVSKGHDCGRIPELCDGADCAEGVVSMVLDEDAGPEAVRYIYAAGTSFAAPIVSGLCAVALGAGIDKCRSPEDMAQSACASPYSLEGDIVPTTDPARMAVAHLAQLISGAPSTVTCPSRTLP